MLPGLRASNARTSVVVGEKGRTTELVFSQTASLSAVIDSAKPLAKSRRFRFADAHGQPIIVLTKHPLPIRISLPDETSFIESEELPDQLASLCRDVLLPHLHRESKTAANLLSR